MFLIYIPRSPRATVAKRLACSPPTKANRVQSPAGPLPDFARGNVAGDASGRRGFIGDIPCASSFHSGAASYSPHFSLDSSKDLDWSGEQVGACSREKSGEGLVFIGGSGEHAGACSSVKSGEGFVFILEIYVCLVCIHSGMASRAGHAAECREMSNAESSAVGGSRYSDINRRLPKATQKAATVEHVDGSALSEIAPLDLGSSRTQRCLLYRCCCPGAYRCRCHEIDFGCFNLCLRELPFEGAGSTEVVPGGESCESNHRGGL
ncbi:hypothetical protein PR048_032919 [Dryococelus australis]|uniref:Uncharacterized protein n=1 Tax=Dryococelus australis TaxID=614101 RepID=A0ABQ9G6I4_9NEOP|nr:hypothetical protein PR048_032919 [Dryococelus australis]